MASRPSCASDESRLPGLNPPTSGESNPIGWSAPDPRVAAAKRISREVAARCAAEVDRDNRFPTEAFEAIREAGLLGFFVPTTYGGEGGDLRTYCQIAAWLGEACLSTAVNWAMHCQQVAVIVDHAAASHGALLAEIAAGRHLIASVVTEPVKGGDLLRANAPLRFDGDAMIVRRDAPVVSFGQEATLFLVTMRAGSDKPPTEVELVLLKEEDQSAQVVGEWNSMGMRGTRSVPMEFSARVGRDRLISAPFRTVALQTMIPVGHLGWSASWLGAARGALDRVLKSHRAALSRADKHTPDEALFREFARVRVSLEMVEALIDRNAQRLDRMRAEGAGPEAYEDPTHNIAINAVKIAASEHTFGAVHDLIELCGMSAGYLCESDLGLERVFRDLRSASLMYHNRRLLDASGRLLLFEHTQIQELWMSDHQSDTSSSDLASRE